MQTQPVHEDVRCDCGKLLARVVRQVVELKCTRCKRVILVVSGRRYAEVGQSACECLEESAKTMG